MNAPCKRTFHKSREFGDTMKPHTSAHSQGMALGPHNGAGPVTSESPCRQMPPQENESDEGCYRLFHAISAPLKSPALRFTCSSCVMARIVRRSFFQIPRLLTKLLLMCIDVTVKVCWSSSGCRRNVAFETTPCITHPDSPSAILYFSHVRVSWR